MASVLDFVKTRITLLLPGAIALWLLSTLIPPHDKREDFATQAFGSLPVLHGGRIQPIDSLARNALLQIREKQEVNTAPWESNPKMLSAAEWLMIVMMKPSEADALPVFRIDNPDLKGLLKLPLDANAEKKTDGKHFSWLQIQDSLQVLQNEAARAGAVDASKRTPYDQAVMRLMNAGAIYMGLENTLEPQNARDWPAELNTYLNGIHAGREAFLAQKAGKEFDQKALDGLVDELQRFAAMDDLKPAMLIPPEDQKADRDAWQTSGAALMEAAHEAPLSFAVPAYARMAGAYRSGRVAEFNQAVADYRTKLSENFAPEMKKASREQFFNHYAPFYDAMYPYLLSFILVLLFWLAPATFEWARRSAVRLVALGLVVHVSGLVFRIVLEGRPPVTNLYSSAIFIGFGAVILGLVLERIWRNGIGLVISSTLGFVSLIIAHHLSLSGDTMEMMRAVLDTNFWLATHVVVVTLGYASTFVGGFLAIVYILLGFFTPRLREPMAAEAGETAGSRANLETGKALAKMVYGIVCFATLFSFVGTVLGGIWADQSWGRFWGWDVKENGALIIVLWNALILHARWGGLVKEQGLMCLAIGGNIVTSWSWFGVNMLGVGLHSYGFTDAAFYWLIGFVVSQLVLIALGLTPQRIWRSYREAEEPEHDGVPSAA